MQHQFKIQLKSLVVYPNKRFDIILIHGTTKSSNDILKSSMTTQMTWHKELKFQLLKTKPILFLIPNVQHQWNDKNEFNIKEM